MDENIKKFFKKTYNKKGLFYFIYTTYHKIKREFPATWLGSRIKFYNYYFLKKPEFPKLVQIESTNHCNFNCKMCYHKNMRKKQPMGYIDFQMYKNIVDEVVDLGCISIQPQWRGETLLHPRFLDMIKYAKEKNVQVFVVSNGALLTPDLSEKIIKTGIDSMKFSFHGATPSIFKEVHGVDLYDKCLKNINEFVEIRNSLGLTKPEVTVSSLIMKDSYKETYRIPNMFKDVDHIEYGHCRFQPRTMPYDGRLFKYSLKRNRPCLAFFKHISITWDGKITVCCSDMNCELQIGNVKDGIENAFNSKRMKELRKHHLYGRYHKIPMCEYCWFKSVPKSLHNKIMDGDTDDIEIGKQL